MKKILFVMILFSGVLLLWSCKNSPTQSYGGGERGSNSEPTSTPTQRATLVPTGTTTPPPAVSDYPIACGPNALALAGGVTYVAGEDDNLCEGVEVLGASRSFWTAYGPTSFIYPAGVGANSAGTTIYVLDAGDEYTSQTADGTAYVYAFTNAGATIASWNSYGGNKFLAPDGLAVDAQGNVYVADNGNNLVEEFGPTGATVTTWTGYNGTAFARPEALAFDASGNLYVGDFGPSTTEVVYEFSGNTSTGPTQTGTNQWNMVENCDMFGIGVDESGNLYVADYGDGTSDAGNGLVEEFASTGGSPTAEWTSTVFPMYEPFGPTCVLPIGSSLLVGDWNNNTLDVFN